jgi:hypothetical protein
MNERVVDGAKKVDDDSNNGFSLAFGCTAAAAAAASQAI